MQSLCLISRLTHINTPADNAATLWPAPAPSHDKSGENHERLLRPRRWRHPVAEPAVRARRAGAGRLPEQAVKVIVHTLPGASSDVLARRSARPWATSWARASWSRTARARAAPSAWTRSPRPRRTATLLAGASSAMVMLPIVLTRKLPYDENKDFAPIGVISRSPFLLVPARLGHPRPAGPHRQGQGASRQDHLRQRGTRHQSAPAGRTAQPAGRHRADARALQGPAAAQADLMGGTIDLLFDTRPRPCRM